ncbi:MAG: hypothetical protein SWY16_24355 [Cyanobacteriota bacterium]|nr:hypothetical protein [Cyanobacteriota bacterium]
MPLLWGWIAEQRKSAKYDRLYKNSISLGLTTETRTSTAALCNFFRAERDVELELHRLLDSPEFAPNRANTARFGFGLRLQCLVLSQIYPLEHFLDLDGEPEVRFGKGRESGKRVKRRLSERRFKKALGLAPERAWSGDNRQGSCKSGSALCRKAFWQWTFCRVEVRRLRPKNEIGELLGAMMDEGKTKKMPIRKLRSAVGAKAAILLFRELATVVCRPDSD